ncbi:MAG TPA: polysaccharide deacetylase family protein [Stellaceae bacterium]|jgi:peptidoglycan/xylan/chitin deacetylase (PgdA/CDA1 family)|nr:polysaccharide deacetylase family protein [Stellaceae bacterium]
MTQLTAWPNGKRIAISVLVMFETWSEGTAPTYSVQATSLKSGSVNVGGAAWSTYGGKTGVWRIIRTLDRHGIPATFFTNARCTEVYPDAVRQILASGHDVAGHAITQDGLLTYMDAEAERDCIVRSYETLGNFMGRAPTGWLSPAQAFTPHTEGLLAEAGYRWHADVAYTDLPHRIQTPKGPIVGVPKSDFTDTRVLKSSPEDLIDVYTGTFDYLYRHEPMSLLTLTLHCHFGGRPMVIAQFEKLIAYFKQFPDVWFARHDELAEWAWAQPEEQTYRKRYFG